MSQANRLQSTIPSDAATSRPLVYLAELRDHRGFGTYFPETSRAETRRDQLINDIASGQVEDVVRIICLDIERGKCTDVSAEFAACVAVQAVDYHGYLPSRLRDFVDRHISFRHANEIEGVVLQAAE